MKPTSTPSGSNLSKTRSLLNSWKYTGLVVITLLGFVLHFLFAWCGYAKSIAWLVPVNESVGEHLKLAYGSVLLFSMAEYPFIKHRVHNYFLAKIAGLIIFDLTILLLFYGYTAILGKDVLLLDILAYLAGAVNGQFLTYYIFGLTRFAGEYEKIALALLITLAVLFGLATYYPPAIPLFRDHTHNSYGIYTP